jgi:hypothetical protein
MVVQIQKNGWIEEGTTSRSCDGFVSGRADRESIIAFWLITLAEEQLME